MYMYTLIKINKKQRANEQILIRERAASEPNRGRVDDVCRAGQPAQIVKLLPPDEFHQRGARALYTCMICHVCVCVCVCVPCVCALCVCVCVPYTRA